MSNYQRAQLIEHLLSGMQVTLSGSGVGWWHGLHHTDVLPRRLGYPLAALGFFPFQVGAPKCTQVHNPEIRDGLFLRILD
jgi:hypothetical protein